MNQRPGRRVRAIGAVTAVVALAAGLWWFLGSRRVKAPIFRFATVERGDVRSTVSATGALSAMKTVLVGTQVSGQVAEIDADFNDHVTKGQLLARIDPTLQRQAVQDAQANLEKATAQLLQASQEYDRNDALFAEQVITGTEFGTAQVNRSVAQAGSRSAQIALDKARQNLSLTNIYAPISGVVVERDVDIGQTVAASLSAPQLFVLAQDLSQMQILAAVDESDIGAIQDGQTAQFTVQPYPGRTFTGAVTQVRLQSKTTDNVVSYTVVVVLANADQKLMPGMTATVEFVTGSATGVLLASNAALRFKPTPDMLVASGLAAATTTSPRRSGDPVGAAANPAASAPATPATGVRAAAAAASPTTRRAGSGAGTAGGFGSLWTLDAHQKLRPIHVRVGLTDGQHTQIMSDSVRVGMRVIVGATSAATAATGTAAANPLTPQPVRRGPGGP